MVYRVADLCRELKISRSTLYKMLAAGRFPRPAVRLGQRTPAWTEEQVREFLEGKYHPKTNRNAW